MTNRKSISVLLVIFAMMIALAGLLIMLSTALAETSITIIQPGDMVFVKLNSTTEAGEAEVMLIEFSQDGKGAIISQFDRNRIAAIVAPDSTTEFDGLKFHHFKTVNNYFKRTDFDKLMRDIDTGKITAWDKVKSYAKQSGAFAWDKTQGFIQWMDDAAESMVDYAEKKGWSDELRDLLKFGN